MNGDVMYKIQQALKNSNSTHHDTSISQRNTAQPGGRHHLYQIANYITYCRIILLHLKLIYHKLPYLSS